MSKVKAKNTYLRTFSIGFSMGAADIVPGVSGGTIAFISGIYEELIYSIKIVTGNVLKSLISGKYKEAFSIIPFKFLLPLGFGILLAVATLSSILTHLLETQPIYLWSFFFGLVIASILVVRKRVVTWDKQDVAIFVTSAVAAYIIVGLVPARTPENLVFYLLSGMIAICAMILPGISGSFLLVIMGKYSQILNAVVERNFVVLGVFIIGAILGISFFSRFLSWLFAKHHDLAIAALIGFMLGSLRKIWPWKETVVANLNDDGHLVPLLQKNILPPALDTSFILALICAAVGVGIILYLGGLHALREHTSDVTSEEFEKQIKRAREAQKH